MRLGIVTDIHESVEQLERALAEFQRLGVDQVVTLGDACDIFSSINQADRVAQLLQDANAIGVWGNHDVAYCHEVSEQARQRANPDTLEYMARLKPHLVLGKCRFSHVEPWIDAMRPELLWYWEGPPDTPEKAKRSFDAVPERIMFLGHFHRWLCMTPSERLPWDGEDVLDLADDTRYLIVIAPVMNGWCAMYDTTNCQLTPIRCAA